MVVQRGGAVADERGTPELPPSHKRDSRGDGQARLREDPLFSSHFRLQRYLAHKKTPTPLETRRTLGISLM